MGKRFPEINPKTGQRVKEVCIDLGITQKELADKIHLSEKTVSSMVRGHSGVTRPTAEAIVRCFPEYRIEWLLGIDDVKTISSAQLLGEAQKEYEERRDRIFEHYFDDFIKAISTFAVLSSIDIRECEDGGLILEDDYGPMEAGKHGSAVKLSPEAASTLTYRISRYIDSVLYDYLYLGEVLTENPNEKLITIVPSKYESLKGGHEDVPEEQ